MDDQPYWETPEYQEAADDLDKRSKALTAEIRVKSSMIYLAVELDLDPEEQERLVDDLWEPLRKMALDPGTVDVVLDALIQSQVSTIMFGVGAILDSIDEEGPSVD